MNQPAQAAVLFVDVSGSTRLYESAGDAAAFAAIDRCITIFKEKTSVLGGRVIKTIGDEVMATFPDPSAAAGAAIEMQIAIDALVPVGPAKIGIRVGFHFGPLVERDGDVFGDSVNVAARLAGLASKGQIMTSRETVDLMMPLMKSMCRRLYSIEVKGRAQSVDLYDILWQPSDDQTSMGAHRPVLDPKPTTLRLRYMDREILLDANKASVTLGRDNAGELRIVEPMASRSHGKIERRLDKFVLFDHSANGTFVTVEGEKEVVLRREEFVLRGHGWIAFGQSRASGTETAEFHCI